MSGTPSPARWPVRRPFLELVPRLFPFFLHAGAVGAFLIQVGSQVRDRLVCAPQLALHFLLMRPYLSQQPVQKHVVPGATAQLQARLPAWRRGGRHGENWLEHTFGATAKKPPTLFYGTNREWQTHDASSLAKFTRSLAQSVLSSVLFETFNSPSRLREAPDS